MSIHSGSCRLRTGNSEEKRVERRETEGFHNGWEKVLEGLGQETQMLEQDENVEPVILEGHLDAVHDASGAVVRFANVGQQAPGCECALFVA